MPIENLLPVEKLHSHPLPDRVGNSRSDVKLHVGFPGWICLHCERGRIGQAPVRVDQVNDELLVPLRANNSHSAFDPFSLAKRVSGEREILEMRFCTHLYRESPEVDDFLAVLRPDPEIHEVEPSGNRIKSEVDCLRSAIDVNRARSGEQYVTLTMTNDEFYVDFGGGVALENEQYLRG